MADRAERILKHLESIVAALERAKPDARTLGEHDARTLVTRARAAIDRFAPPRSAYAKEAAMIEQSTHHASWKAEQLCAIVVALRDDYEHGGLESIAELVHADLFDDFLEIAGELHGKGFLAPSAVVAGSVLEEQLRKLADKRQIARLDGNGRPKSVETLSVDLRQAGEFTEVLRKSVQAWYAQRNAAAHGQLGALVDTEVERMIDGIRDFVARHPA